MGGWLIGWLIDWLIDWLVGCVGAHPAPASASARSRRERKASSMLEPQRPLATVISLEWLSPLLPRLNAREVALVLEPSSSCRAVCCDAMYRVSRPDNRLVKR